ncbi:MAG: hypothetical protein U1F52_03740 [Burkholderiales bacterium]
MRSALCLSAALLSAAPAIAHAVAVVPGTELSPVAAAGNVAVSATADAVYGPSLDTLTRSGINLFGDEFQNTASSRLESGNPVVEASGTPGAFAQAALVFSFRVDGPSSEAIPILVTGTVRASSTAGPASYAEAFIARSDGFAPFLDTMLLACVGTDPECLDTGTQEKTGTLSYSVTANVEQTIYLHAFADARGARGAGFISAFADPVVVVDPTFAGASEYTISFSPGVSAPVPEPGGWLLTGLGLGVLAWRGTRRRH